MTTLTLEQTAQICAAAGWTGNDLVTAVAVSRAESSGRTEIVHTNVNGSKDYGLFQLNDVNYGHNPPPNWGDPAANAAMAHALWSQHGWRPWATYNSGAYLAYTLPAAQAVQSTGAGSRDPLTALTDTITGAGDQASQTASAALGGVRLAASAGEWVSDPANWLRVVYVAAGLALIVGGLVVVAGGRPGVRSLVGA